MFNIVHEESQLVRTQKTMRGRKSTTTSEGGLARNVKAIDPALVSSNSD